MKNANCCRFHEGYRNMFTLGVDPRVNCSRCQSIKDQISGNKVMWGHVPGKWCKEHNHCDRCCEIKHIVRVLKHYGGICSFNTRCPVCEWSRNQHQSHCVKIMGSKLPMKKMIIRLYKLRLGTKPK